MSDAMTPDMKGSNSQEPGHASQRVARPQRSYARLVIGGALQRWGARIGIAWVGLILLLAVFAPFIANSHPIALKQEGQWTYPLFRFLTLSDVLLLISAGLAMLTACCFKLRLSDRVLGWVVAMGLIIPASCWDGMLEPFFFDRSVSVYSGPLSWVELSLVSLGLVIYLALLFWLQVIMWQMAGLPRWIKSSVMTVAGLVMLCLVAMGLFIPSSVWNETFKPLFFDRALFAEGEPVSWGVWWLVLCGYVIYAAVLLLLLVMLWRMAQLSFLYKAGVMVVAGLVMACLVAWPISPPRLVVYDVYRTEAAAGNVQSQVNVLLPFSPADRLRDVENSRLKPPSLTHPMGTTNNGADLASNMIYATRIALSIGFISTGIAVCIGIFVGGLMGYFSGWVDLFGMRLVEIFSAIPTFILLLTFVAAFGANLYIMMVIIGLTSWVGDAVFIRAEFLRLRKQDFVQAAIAAGLPLRSVLFRHMLPNGIAPVLVSASFGVAGAILAESTLSFLGIGLKEEASWGRLLNDALGSGGTFYWWLALYPGLAIFVTVFAYNLVGEALRDAIDPHLQKAAQI